MRKGRGRCSAASYFGKKVGYCDSSLRCTFLFLPPIPASSSFVCSVCFTVHYTSHRPLTFLTRLR